MSFSLGLDTSLGLNLGRKADFPLLPGFVSPATHPHPCGAQGPLTWESINLRAPRASTPPTPVEESLPRPERCSIAFISDYFLVLSAPSVLDSSNSKAELNVEEDGKNITGNTG